MLYRIVVVAAVVVAVVVESHISAVAEVGSSVLAGVAAAGQTEVEERYPVAIAAAVVVDLDRQPAAAPTAVRVGVGSWLIADRGMTGRSDLSHYMGWRQLADTSVRTRSGVRLQAEGNAQVGHMSPVAVVAAGIGPGVLVAAAALVVDVDVLDMRH